MVQSPTFDQTKDEDLCIPSLLSFSKGITVPENVLIKVSLIKERAHFVSEFWELSDFFFVASEYDTKAKNWKAETPALMQELIVVVDEITDFTSMNIEIIVKTG
jgi:glutamyl-tRNA synthetase